MQFDNRSIRLCGRQHALRWTIAVALLASLTGCGKQSSVDTTATGAAKTHSEALPNSEPIDTELAAADVASAANKATQLRIATFNVSLFRDKSGQLIEDLVGGKNDQAHQLAHIVQTVRPDVVLLNEFDFDANHKAIDAFTKEYLAVGHDGAEPITFAHFYTNEVNTGVPSGVDFDNDDRKDGWNDCYGFGKHPGQYGMVVLSKFPIDATSTRTLRKLLWKDMKDANLPIDPKSSEPFYSEEATNVFRISSKSHWDVVIDVADTQLHFLVSHPTPPVFDGAEDRNGKRNHDEIRLWADYIANDPSGYIVDDTGTSGGLPSGSHFVIAGDLNADPNDGASFSHAIRQLTEHKLVESSIVPTSGGSAEQNQNGVNSEHTGDPAHDTADFDDRRTGNLRADYVLPSKTMKLLDAGVFWPATGEAGADLVKATDHRMVWIDVELPLP